MLRWRWYLLRFLFTPSTHPGIERNCKTQPYSSTIYPSVSQIVHHHLLIWRDMRQLVTASPSFILFMTGDIQCWWIKVHYRHPQWQSKNGQKWEWFKKVLTTCFINMYSGISPWSGTHGFRWRDVFVSRFSTYAVLSKVMRGIAWG